LVAVVIVAHHFRPREIGPVLAAARVAAVAEGALLHKARFTGGN
jgi:hypothetical protein